MTINQDKSDALKTILKVGEDVLVTHKGDSENPRLKSSTTVGAENSNQEFVMVAEEKFEQALCSNDDELANDIICTAESMNIETENKNIETLIVEIESIAETKQQSIPTDVKTNPTEWKTVPKNGNTITDDDSVPELVERTEESSTDEEFDLLSEIGRAHV